MENRSEITMPPGYVVSNDAIQGDDEQETQMLNRMALDARNFLSQQPWCTTVGEGYFAGGIGNVFAIFLFNLLPDRSDIPLWQWVMYGDIPPAYLPVEDADNPQEAFESYLSALRKWCENARSGKSVENLIPVNVPPNAEWADDLEKRLALLSEIVPPFLFRYISNDGRT